MQAILDRHAARVKATKERIELKLKGLKSEKMAIEAEIQVASSRTLLRELREVDDQIAKCNIELTDKVEMNLTKDEKISHSNAWRTHRETTESLKKSRGKVYSRLIGQCIQVLIDKMKQDTVVSRLIMYHTKVLMYPTMVLLARLTKVRC